MSNFFPTLTKRQQETLEVLYIASYDKDRLFQDSNKHLMVEKYSTHSKYVMVDMYDDACGATPKVTAKLEKLGLVNVSKVGRKKIYRISKLGKKEIEKYIVPFEETNSSVLFIKNEQKILDEFENKLYEADGIDIKLDKRINAVKDFLNNALLILEKEKNQNIAFKPDMYMKLEDKLASTLIDEYKEKQLSLKEWYIVAKDEVVSQAEKKRGFYTFTNPKTNEIIKVAKVPFVLWAIGHKQCLTDISESLVDLSENLQNEWEVVTGSNIKLPNDCQYHNDWIIGAGFNPNEFYDKMDEEYKWMQSLVTKFALYRIEDGDFNIENDIEFVSKDDDNNTIEFDALPITLNSDITFPFCFRPFYQENASSFDSKNINDFISAVAVKQFDDSLIDIAIELTNNPYNLILTNNGTKAAHIVNVAKDLNVNILEVSIDLSELEHKSIYEINKIYGVIKIRKIATQKSYSVDNLRPIQDCDVESMQNENITPSPKVKNLAKLYKSGMKVPYGFYMYGKKNIASIETGGLIARSCGSEEASRSTSYSGIFKSIVLKDCSYSEAIKEVIESFTSSRAKKYAKSLGIDLPVPGVLIQEYKEASLSCVVKTDLSNIHFEYLEGSCNAIVEGTKETTKLSIDRFQLNHYNENEEINQLKDLIPQIEKVLGFDFVEVEAVYSKGQWFIVQAIELKMEDDTDSAKIDDMKVLQEIKVLLEKLDNSENISRQFKNKAFGFSNEIINSEIVKLKMKNK